MIKRLLLTFLIAIASLSAAAQDSSFPGAPEVKGRLFSPVASGGSSQPLALEISLPLGWHTYWRNPGVAGAPPQLDWQGSTNLKQADILWPAPKRFQLEGLQTFGYDGTFILPLTITLNDKDAPTELKLHADLVVCTDICVPASFDVSHTLDGTAAAAKDIAGWQRAMQRLPIPYSDAGIKIDHLALNSEAATLTLTTTSASGWSKPDVIVEARPNAVAESPSDISFSAPHVSVTGKQAIFTLKLVNKPDTKLLKNADVMLTFIDEQISADGDAHVTEALPVAQAAPPAPSLLYILAIALLGGLILNLMPCVLPVLSLKLLSVVQHAGETRAQIRRGFLASAAGILTSFWLIAAALLIVKQSGMALGWGIQFQHPLFLSILLAIVLGFTANLWGWFEINAPGTLQNKLAAPDFGKIPSARHEFLTGMLATLLATPCTAPFVGTSVGFALAGSARDIVLIFTALGIGLALPYLLVALFPALAQRLPRPGRWMLVLRAILGFALLATAGWLLSILAIQLNIKATAIMATLGTITLFALWRRWFWIASLIALLLALSPLAFRQVQEDAPAQTSQSALQWNAFEPARIPELVAQGKTVVLDITASWCLTCHVNERLVIANGKVQAALTQPDIYLMRGDWTQPNDAIAAFLKTYKRAGIPFNLVVGPKAPEGIVLPELLTPTIVTDTLAKAR